MIVISSDLALSLAAAVPVGTPWIGYHNLVTITNASASVVSAGYPAANLADPATNVLWRGVSASASEYLYALNLSYPNPIDYLAIARHNFGSTGAILSVEGFTSGWAEIAPQQIVPDDSPILFAWTPQVLTHARLRIQLPAGVSMFCSVMYVGKLLVLERGIDIGSDHVPIKFGRRANIVSGMSESGNFLGRIVTGEYRESKAVFKHFTPTFYRASVDPFVAASKITPFFWVWAPSEYPGEVGYVWMVNEPQPEQSPVTRRMAVEFQMRGIA